MAADDVPGAELVTIPKLDPIDIDAEEREVSLIGSCQPEVLLLPVKGKLLPLKVCLRVVNRMVNHPNISGPTDITKFAALEELSFRYNLLNPTQ